MSIIAAATSARSLTFEETDRPSSRVRDGDRSRLALEFFGVHSDSDVGTRTSVMLDFVGRRDGIVTVPLEVVTEHHGDYWTLSNPDTGIFGTGDTPEAARRDFRAALLEHRDVLRRTHQLTPGLKAQLDFLERHLRR